MARKTRKPEPKPQVDILSLMIAAVALTVLVLFLFPWLQGDEALSGLDVGSRNLVLTEDFPAGIVFILPLVTGSVLIQYYRRVRDTMRPRRRSVTAAMLIIGLVCTILWVRIYTLNATESLNTDLVTQSESPDDLSVDPDATSSAPPVAVTQQEPYTTGEVLQDRFTFELWLHLALGMALVVLPFLDPRPEVDPPNI